MRRARQRTKNFPNESKFGYTLADLLKDMPRGQFPISADLRGWLDAPPVGLEVAADAVEKMKLLMRNKRRTRRLSIKRLINEGRA